MFKHGKITHEYGLSYARGIPYHFETDATISGNVQIIQKSLTFLIPCIT